MASKGTRDERIGELADERFGVIGRTELLAAGISADVISDSLAMGRLRPLHRGVYAVGHTAIRREGWWRAALAACGPEAVVSDTTAAIVWDLRRGEPLPVHVTTAGGAGRKRRGLVVHHRILTGPDWMTIDGLRVTTPARTIVDLAGALSPRERRRLIERAQDVDRFDPAEIAAVLERCPRARGRRELFDLLALMQPAADGTRSHLERLFLAMVRKHGLPRPEVNSVIAGRQRDFSWPRERLVVETDGYAYHSSKAAQRRDKRRDRTLTAAGWRPARFTFEEVALEPAATAAELGALLSSSSR